MGSVSPECVVPVFVCSYHKWNVKCRPIPQCDDITLFRSTFERPITSSLFVTYIKLDLDKNITEQLRLKIHSDQFISPAAIGPVEDIKLNKNIQTVGKLEVDHKVCTIFQIPYPKIHFHIRVVF